MAVNLLDNLRLEIEVPGTGLPNLVQNPSGQLGGWGWVTPVAGSFMYQGAISGVKTIAYRHASSGAGYFYTELMAVASGKYIGVRYDIAAIQASHNVKAQLDYFNSAKAYISSSAQNAAASSGTQYMSTNQAPAGTAYVRLRIDLYNGVGNPSALATVDLRNVMLTWANTTGAIQTVRTNLVPNPSVEINAGFWTPAGTFPPSTARSTAQFYQGTASLAVTTGGGGGGQAVYTEAKVTGGNDYTLSFFVRAASQARNAYARIEWYDAASALLGTVTGATSTATTTWSRRTVTGTAPAAATTARVYYFGGISGAPGEVFYVDAFMLEQGSAAGLYFDGSSPAAGTKTYAWTGTVGLSTSTETDTAFAFVEPITWQNILGPTSEIQINRKELDAGLLTATLYDALLDPANVSSVIKKGKRVRVRALNQTAGYTNATVGEWYNLYSGTITNANTKYTQAGDPITISASDNAAVLANMGENSTVAVIDDLRYTLEGKGVPWNINGSGNQATSANVVAYNENASMLDQIAITRDTALGRAWVDVNNVINVFNSVSAGNYVNFTDEPNTSTWNQYENYTDIDVDYNTDDCVNSVTIKWLRYNSGTGQTQEITYGPYENAASIATYGPMAKTFTIAGTSANENPTYIAAYAQSILDMASVPTVRARSLTYNVSSFKSVTNALYLDLFGKAYITFRDKLSLKLHSVAGIEHKITPDNWSVTYTFTDTNGVAAPTYVPSPPFTGVGVSPGVWQPYTPTLANVTLGTGGTKFGSYTRIGNTIHWRVLVTLGTGGQATAAPLVGLPVTAAYPAFGDVTGLFIDSGSNAYASVVQYSTNIVGMYCVTPNGAFGAVGGVTPFTWAVNDMIWVSGTYEAA